MRIVLPAILTVVVVLAGCDGSGDADIQSEPDAAIPADSLPEFAPLTPLRNLNDEQKLMLIDDVPFGITYIELQQLLPDVGPLSPEGMGALEHLTEARLETRAMDREVEIEFNFDRDSLYSYYFQLGEVDCSEGDSLYAELKEFYAGEFGEHREEDEAEPGYRARSSYWTLEEAPGGLAVTLAYQAELCRLGWGFQQTAP